MNILKQIAGAALLVAGIGQADAQFLPSYAIPANGSEVARLSKITVVWPGEWLEGVSYDECGKVVDASGVTVATLTCEENYAYDAACDLILSEEIVTPGLYTIYVDAGCAESEDEEPSEAFELTYTVADSGSISMKLVSSDPADGETVSSISRIETYWSMTVKSVDSSLECAVFDDEGEKAATLDVSVGVFSTDPVSLTLRNPIVKEGTYTVVIPAGKLVSGDGVKSEAVELTYTVEEMKVTTDLWFEVIPEEGTISEERFPDIEFEFEEDIVMNMDEFEFVCDSEEGEKVVAEAMMIFRTVSLDCGGIKTSGKWTLTVPEGAFASEDGRRVNEERTFVWTFDKKTSVEESFIGRLLRIDGSRLIVGCDGTITLTDISGRLVVSGSGSLETELESGVYLVRLSDKEGVRTFKVRIK